MNQMSVIKNLMVMMIGLILVLIVKASDHNIFQNSDLYNTPFSSSHSIDQSAKKKIIGYNWCLIYKCNRKCLGKDKAKEQSVIVGDDYEKCFLPCWNICSQHYLRKGLP